jgi:hypothetical protein
MEINPSIDSITQEIWMWKNAALPVFTPLPRRSGTTSRCGAFLSEFLLEQNSRVIGIAPNLDEIGTDGEQASGVIHIPKSAIRSIKTLITND